MGAVDERTIFEKGPVVIFEWRNAAGWPVEYVSPNVRDIFGYTAEQFRRGEIEYARLVLEDDLERVAREVVEAAEGGVASFAHAPYRVTRADGAVRWLYDYTHVIRDDAGQVTHFLGYVFDITSGIAAEQEKAELERRLLHAQKLESLGVLAGGVAHDFNNLLTGIIGQASLLRRELAADSPRRERLSHGIEQIDQLGQRAADLTRQLLAYSGKGSLVVEPVDLNALVEEMTSILEVVLSKKARLVKELAAGLPRIMADRTQIQQVLMNLLTNASEALGGRPGTISLRTRSGQKSEDELRELFPDAALPAGDYVLLEVEDTGCGMSDESLQRLFDPFFTTKVAGRGLGMSAVLGIVRGHRGAIRVRSTLNVGSSFVIAIPATEPRFVRRESTLAPPAIRAKGTVLVVDDESFIRKTVAMLLGELGFSTIEASDGAEAVDRFAEKQSEIVLVILDMTMPVLSGVEALRAIRGMAPNVPVILSSGYSEDEIEQREHTVEPSAFLQKPYRIEDLERALRQVLPAR